MLAHSAAASEHRRGQHRGRRAPSAPASAAPPPRSTRCRGWCRPGRAAGRRPRARRAAGRTRRRRRRRPPRRPGTAAPCSWPGLLQLGQPVLGALAQLGQLAELDRVRRAGLRAGGLLVVLEAVVAERALPHPAVVLALVEHPERARRDAVAAAVADVLLHDHGPELGAEQRAGRAHLEARGVGAVLADVGGHQPADAVALLVGLHAGLDRAVALRRPRPASAPSRRRPAPAAR